MNTPTWILLAVSVSSYSSYFGPGADPFANTLQAPYKEYPRGSYPSCDEFCPSLVPASGILSFQEAYSFLGSVQGSIFVSRNGQNEGLFVRSDWNDWVLFDGQYEVNEDGDSAVDDEDCNCLNVFADRSISLLRRADSRRQSQSQSDAQAQHESRKYPNTLLHHSFSYGEHPKLPLAKSADFPSFVRLANGKPVSSVTELLQFTRSATQFSDSFSQQRKQQQQQQQQLPYAVSPSDRLRLLEWTLGVSLPGEGFVWPSVEHGYVRTIDVAGDRDGDLFTSKNGIDPLVLSLRTVSLSPAAFAVSVNLFAGRNFSTIPELVARLVKAHPLFVQPPIKALLPHSTTPLSVASRLATPPTPSTFGACTQLCKNIAASRASAINHDEDGCRLPQEADCGCGEGRVQVSSWLPPFLDESSEKKYGFLLADHRQAPSYVTPPLMNKKISRRLASNTLMSMLMTSPHSFSEAASSPLFPSISSAFQSAVVLGMLADANDAHAGRAGACSDPPHVLTLPEKVKEWARGLLKCPQHQQSHQQPRSNYDNCTLSHEAPLVVLLDTFSSSYPSLWYDVVLWWEGAFQRSVDLRLRRRGFSNSHYGNNSTGDTACSGSAAEGNATSEGSKQQEQCLVREAGKHAKEANSNVLFKGGNLEAARVLNVMVAEGKITIPDCNRAATLLALAPSSAATNTAGARDQSAKGLEEVCIVLPSLLHMPSSRDINNENFYAAGKHDSEGTAFVSLTSSETLLVYHQHGDGAADTQSSYVCLNKECCGRKKGIGDAASDVAPRREKGSQQGAASHWQLWRSHVWTTPQHDALSHYRAINDFAP